MNVKDIKIIDSISNSISICQVDEVKILHISCESVDAGISLFGGHLLWFKPQGEKEVLWLSDDAIYDGKKAIRGGVPICFPWFGNAGGEQTHGFARNVEWQLVDTKELKNGIEVSLRLTESQETISLWPHKFQNILTFSITDTLEISLTTCNTDEHEWSYSGAIHTYFGIGDIADTYVSGVGKKYFDGTKNYIECEGENEITLDKEVIRVCIDPDDTIVITDSNNQRNMAINNSGHNAAVVWNPWAEITKGMADMPDEDYKKMLCVESIIYGTAPALLKPGESHTLKSTISVKTQQ